MLHDLHTLINTCARVPIYSLSSWVSILSLTAAMFVDPVRDVYEVYPPTKPECCNH